MSMLTNPFSIYFSKKLQKAYLESEAQKYAADRHAEAIEKAAEIHQKGETQRQKLYGTTMELLERLKGRAEKEKTGAEIAGKEKLFEKQLPILREIMKAKGYDIGDALASPGVASLPFGAESFALPEMGGRSWSDETGAHWEADKEVPKKPTIALPSTKYWGPQDEEDLTQQAITPRQSVADIAEGLLEDMPKKKKFWESIWERMGEIPTHQRYGYF